MKFKLREEYVPISYRRKLWDQWQRLDQWNMTVSEYIAKFDEFMTICDVDEPETVTIARFRGGLRAEIMYQLIWRKVDNFGTNGKD